MEYLFLVNAAIYFVLDRLFAHTPSAQLHTVAKSFRFVIPGHVMASLLLGMAAKTHFEARVFEWTLPARGC